MLSLEAFYKRDFDDPDSEVVLSVPKDYIIIVDNSEEMNGANDASTKMNAAKRAVKLILNKIKSDTDTRVALIGYGDTNNANNTGLYIGNSFKAYSTLDNELYSKAFQTQNDTSYNDLLNSKYKNEIVLIDDQRIIIGMERQKPKLSLQLIQMIMCRLQSIQMLREIFLCRTMRLLDIVGTMVFNWVMRVMDSIIMISMSI